VIAGLVRSAWRRTRRTFTGPPEGGRYVRSQVRLKADATYFVTSVRFAC